jgi:predicted phage terminase large subunit-like protein
VVVVGTILHYDSLLAALTGSVAGVSQARASGWEGRRYQAVEAFSDQPLLWERWESIYSTRQEHLGVTGPEAASAYFLENKDAMLAGTKVLWEPLENYEQLMVLRLREGRASFGAEKQNEPLDPAECLFSEQELQFWDERFPTAEALLAALGPNARVYGAWDPSLGRRGGRGDASAIVTVAENADTKVMYVLSADISPRTPAEAIARIVQLARIARYEEFAVESNGFQEVLVTQLREAADRAGVYLRVREINHSSDKKGRIESLQPLVAQGLLVFSRRHSTLLDQLRQFPLGAHDDGPDALEMAVAVGRAYGRYRCYSINT